MEIKDPVGPMLYASFNAQATRLCVGTRYGFMIFQVDPFQRVCRSDSGGCSIVQVLDDKPLAITVGSGDHVTSCRRVVKLYSFQGEPREICKLPFEIPVLGVRLTAQRLIVTTESEIHIYNTTNISFVEKLSTSPNPKGLCALGISKGLRPNDPDCLTLAYPCLRGPLKGDLVLYDPIAMIQTRKMEGVHNHPLQFIQFSPDGSSVATASEEGTLIKVTPITAADETPTCTFRRGMMARADISAIAFNNDTTLLAVSSTNGTTHVFDIIQEQEKHAQIKSTLGMLTGWVVGDETRSFCLIRLPAGTQNIVSFSKDSKRIFTVTQDGKFSVWQIPEAIPATWSSSMQYPTCKLVREDDLLVDYNIGEEDFEVSLGVSNAPGHRV